MLFEEKQRKLIHITATFRSEGGGDTPLNLYISCEDETKALQCILKKFERKTLRDLHLETIGKVLHL